MLMVGLMCALRPCFYEQRPKCLSGPWVHVGDVCNAQLTVVPHDRSCRASGAGSGDGRQHHPGNAAIEQLSDAVALPIVKPFDIYLAQVQGFPTLKLVTADGTILDYSGDRSEEDLIEFVESHAGTLHPESTYRFALCCAYPLRLPTGALFEQSAASVICMNTVYFIMCLQTRRPRRRVLPRRRLAVALMSSEILSVIAVRPLRFLIFHVNCDSERGSRKFLKRLKSQVASSSPTTCHLSPFTL